MADLTDLTDAEKAGATQIPVISQKNAQGRRDTGFTEDGHYNDQPFMVDPNSPASHGTRAAAPPAAAPAASPARDPLDWGVSNDEANVIMGQKILPPTAAAGASQSAQGAPPPVSPGLLEGGLAGVPVIGPIAAWAASPLGQASLRQNNFIGAAVDRWLNHPDSTAPEVPGYSPFANNGIAGYEDHAAGFADSYSPQQTQVLKERFDAGRQADLLIHQAGAAGWASSAAAGAIDPISLTMMMIPGLGEINAVSRVARVGALVATNVAFGEAQQGAISAMNGTSYTEGILPRLATNALLAGVLGTLATRVPKAEFNALADKADAAINPPGPGLAKAQESNTFTGQAAGAGRTVGMTQPKGTPVEKLFSNFADRPNATPEQQAAFRASMFDRANADPKQFAMDTVSSHTEVLPSGNTVKIDATASGRTRVQLLRDDKVVAAANVQNGMIDSIASVEKGHGDGLELTKYIDRNKIGNIDEVPDRSPGYVAIQKQAIADRANAPQVVPAESTGGAAAVKGTTLEQETFAKGGQWIAKIDAALPRWLASPTLRIMQSSPMVESRRLVQRIVDLGAGLLNKNKENIATPSSVEMQSNARINSREAQIFRAHDDLFADYAKTAGPDAMNKHEFGAEILKALSNGDKHEIPQVAKMAQKVRPFFDADHAELQRIAPDADYDMLTRTAESYAPRFWDNDKVNGDRTNFEQFLHNHFTNNPKTVPVPEATVTMAPAKLGEGNAESFINDFHAQNTEPAPLGYSGKRVGKANVSLSQDPLDKNKVHLDMLQADEPGKKQGRRALEKTLALADKHGVTVQLDAVPVGKNGPSTAKLMEFYREHGFKPPSEPSGAATMVREGLNDRIKANADERAELNANKPAIDEGPIKGTTSVASQEHLNKLKAVDAEGKRIEKEHAAAQPKETMQQPGVGPPKPIERSPAEVSAAVQDTLDRIQHAVRGTADIGTGVRNPKSTKARVLDVTDNAARPWLSDDFEGTIKSYMKTMVPHIEMHRQFGSVTLDTEFQQISDAYRVKMAATENARGATSESIDAAKNKLRKERDSDIADLTLARDRVLGQAGAKNNSSQAVVRAAQLVRSVNYMRSLGGQIFSAIPDIGRVQAHYGMTETATRLAQFMGNSELRNLSMADAQRMGTATDVALHTREHSMDGIGDEVPNADKTSRFMQNLTAKFTKWSMITHWDSLMRVMASMLEQDRIARVIKGERVSGLETAQLASHGIGAEDLDAIREQWAKYGSNEEGLNRARTELWDNKDAANKVEQAVQRAASSHAFFVGKGDMPASADTQLGKFMFQFKGFAMSGLQRLSIPLAQGIAHGDVKAAGGLSMMLTLGGLRYYLKEKAAGREPDLSPRNLASEMAQGSGMLAMAPDAIDPIMGMLHLPRFSKFKDHSWEETLGGATIGEVDTLGKVISSMSGGQPTAQDLHKLRQLVPYNNHFALNRLFNMVEGKTADAFNLKNATHRPALDYLNPAKDPENKPVAPDNQHFLGIQSIPNSQI